MYTHITFAFPEHPAQNYYSGGREMIFSDQLAVLAIFCFQL